MRFSEKSHRYIFNTNYSKTVKDPIIRPKTARSLSAKRKSKSVKRNGYLNNSYNKTPKPKGIYYNYEGVYRMRKNNLMGTSPGLKMLTKKLLTTKKKTARLNEKFRKLIENKNRLKEMMPIHKKPLNVHRIESPTESTESASRNLNMFETT
mmetsp:Transcript_17119/g.15086  ORF Transcript_17119/g.15086 Transcript_17119/m.15086 type:complete len:151 (+) Transcript_17119:652-1104(+)